MYNSDPLQEKKYQVAPGLIYKYKGRILWLISNQCSSQCNFCFRKNFLKKHCLLTSEEIKKGLQFIKNNQEIKEVILSGGDPLFTPQQYLENFINELVSFQQKGIIDIIRFHTRLPISNPDAIKTWHFQLIAKIKNSYIVIHINHPNELTNKSIKIINNLRKKAGAIILSQSVLLKGINDSTKTLMQLFNLLVKEGIQPYYLHQNDIYPWTKKYSVPIKKAIKIWRALRPRLSGIAATARFVIDTPYGNGKIAFPEGDAWEINYSYFRDYKKKKYYLK